MSYRPLTGFFCSLFLQVVCYGKQAELLPSPYGGSFFVLQQ